MGRERGGSTVSLHSTPVFFFEAHVEKVFIASFVTGMSNIFNNCPHMALVLGSKP